MYSKIYLFVVCIVIATQANINAQQSAANDTSNTSEIAYGRYLATIGACSACHTPSKADEQLDSAKNRIYKTDPDWFSHLNKDKALAGGVPFIIRLSPTSHAVVVTPNITPDSDTGIGSWTEDQIVDALRTGRRPEGRALFRFPPHTFYEHLAENDLRAIAQYLKSIPPVTNSVPLSDLPFPTIVGVPVCLVTNAPMGRSLERADYLIKGLVSCEECHSHHEGDQLIPFVGGKPGDSSAGVFRLGPDLPLKSTEKGFGAFPYPGYAVLYGGNLTRFGNGGDLSYIPAADVVNSIRFGMSSSRDIEGRPLPLAHVMLWQYYSSMTDDDALSIAEYIKSLNYTKGALDGQPRLFLFGSDVEAAFKQAFGENPSKEDADAFGFKLKN